MATPPPEIDEVLLYERALRQVTGKYDYYETYWAPALKGAAAKVIHALWKVTRFYADTWRKEEDIYPRYAEVAQRAQVARSTVGRVLHRVQTREEAQALSAEYGQRIEVGDFAYGWHGEWIGDKIAAFIKAIDNRWAYDERSGMVRQRSNHYSVAALLPPVPQHQQAVYDQYETLVAQHLEEKNRIHEGDPKADSRKSPTMGQQITTPHQQLEQGIPRSPERGVVGAAIGNSSSEEHQATPAHHIMSAANQDQERSTKNEATEDHTASNRNDSAARRSVGQTSEDAPPPARHPVTEEDHADRDYALFEAERFFNQLGSKFADTAAKCMVRKMEEAQAPYALMYKVVRHAKRQVDHQNSISNRAAYLTTCTERLITRAMKKQWQLAALIAEDERAWEKSKKGSAKAPQPHQDDRVSLSDMVDISRQVWG